MKKFTDKQFFIFTAVCAGLIFGGLLYNFRMWLLDDAFISMRYARNWASGNGLVFNSGERVEGYTNFLWVSFMAIWFKLNINVPFSARVTGIIFSIFMLTATIRFAYQKTFAARFPFFLLTMIFVTQGAFAVWANSGMETMMYTALLTGSALLLTKRNSRNKWFTVLSGIGFALAVLTRPDGILGFGLSFCFLLVTDNGKYCLNKKNVYRSFLLAVSFIIIYLPYFLWRYNYFGWFYPNTYYAKVAFSTHHFIRGCKYLGSFILDHWFIFLGTAGLLFNHHKKNPSVHYFLSLVVIYLLYCVYVGGDVFPGYRFLTPVMPLLYLCFAYGIREFSNHPSARIKNITSSFLIFCICFQVLQLNFREDYNRIYIDRVSEVGRKVGVWLRKHIPPSTVIALNPVGAIPYYSGLKTIDMLGLTDEYIAHHAKRVESEYAGHEIGDGQYVLSRKPDIIVLDGPWGDITPLFKGDYEIIENAQFKTNYVFRNIPIDDIIFQCFVRKESQLVLEQINKHRYYK